MVSDYGQAHVRPTPAVEEIPVLDRAGLAAIYDEHYPLIYRYIYRQVGDVEVTRDLAAVNAAWLEANWQQFGDRY